MLYNLKMVPQLISLLPYFIVIPSRSNTSPTYRTMNSLHGVIKRPLKRFALLGGLHIPVHMHLLYK